MDSIFRSFHPTEAERSDRAAGDRLRHREKIRQSVRDNIADIVAEESIIGKSGERIIKVPIRGIKEYRFVFGDNNPGVGQGDEGTEPGQVIQRGEGEGEQGNDRAGDRAGVDYYETEITLDELIEIMFEDLDLPDLERKKLREIEADRLAKRKGYRAVGIQVRLDKRRTAMAKVRRKMAAKLHHPGEENVDGDPRFPFHDEDLTYRHMSNDPRKESNAVVLCIMDTSGSMDTMKKYLARSFFFLLFQFIRTKYRSVEVVFIAHHTEAREVTEDEFFHKGESGGTFISSGYEKALAIIEERYHPSLWNVYAFHCSDGDNFDSDNDIAVSCAEQLSKVANLFGYGEIKPQGSRYYESSMLSIFRQIKADNFHTLLIERKEDVWSSFKVFLSKDRAREEA